MSVKRISERYARMIVETAQSKGELETVLNDAKYFQEAVSNRDLYLMYKSPIITSAKKKSISKEIFENNISELFMNFIDLTINKNREEYLPDIVNAIMEKSDEIKGITRIEIITASEVSEDTLKEIKTKIAETGAARETIIAEHSVNPDLIGGYKVVFEGQVLDASIQNKLNQLKKSFNPAYN